MEKWILIFALLGSAIKVLEVVVAMFRRKENVVPTSAAPEQTQVSVDPAVTNELARLTRLLEDQILATEDMKDKYAEVLQRLSAIETSTAAPKQQAPIEEAQTGPAEAIAVPSPSPESEARQPKPARRSRAKGRSAGASVSDFSELEGMLFAHGGLVRSEPDAAFEVVR